MCSRFQVFIGKSGFAKSSYVDAAAGKPLGDNSCPALTANADVPCSDAQALDVIRFVSLVKSQSDHLARTAYVQVHGEELPAVTLPAPVTIGLSPQDLRDD